MLLPNHECEKGRTVSVEHIYIVFVSLYILKQIFFDPVFRATERGDRRGNLPQGLRGLIIEAF